MKTKHIIVVSILIVIFITACNDNKSYIPNKNSPDNVRKDFYEKSVEVMNFYIEKVNARATYTDEDNEYLLEYYRSTPSNSEEEINIKTSLTYLDLMYRTFEANIKDKKVDIIDSNLKDFQIQLEEVKQLLEISN